MRDSALPPSPVERGPAGPGAVATRMPTDAAVRDADIASLLAQGQFLPAFEQLVARYDTKVYRLCLSLLGESASARDAAQDSLLRVWRALDRYDPAVAALSTWIYAITRNRCLSMLSRRRDVEVSLAEPEIRELAERVTAPQETLDNASAGLLRRFVQELPEPYRASIVLFYFEERSVAETASMLGLGEATLKTRLHRGRAMLLRQITQAGLGDPGKWLLQEDER